jgi:hypothetical protein
MCPSARAEPGAGLLGVVGEDGIMGLLKDPIPIDQSFIDTVSESGLRPEQRFRFTAPCVEERCTQWSGCKCTVIDQVQAQLEPVDEHALRPCGIRSACRWFVQAGPEACKVCLFVITDTRVDTDDEPVVTVTIE